jgi:hypothetical protein
MKLALFAASAATALAVTSGTASAQPVVVQRVVQPAPVVVAPAAPSIAVGIGGRGFSVGGVISPGVVAAPQVVGTPAYVTAPQVVVAGPTVVPVVPPVVRYGYYPYGYGRPYYAPHGYPHHHHRHW